jgi:exodeoxyribonuclease V alpha subunit
MTIHKSQGSQFHRVALVLARAGTPIQTRELVYTGLTRAKSRVDWLGGEDDLREAFSRTVARASGLVPLLGG